MSGLSSLFALPFLYEVLSPLDSLGSLVVTLTTLFSTTNFNADLISTPNPSLHQAPLTYDFIVVGGGSAGSVLANRLTESGNYQVLLLEAGGDPTKLNDIPYLAGDNLGLPETDWMYTIVPQVNSCLATVNKTIIWNRGKSVGGSSNLNYMVYARGNPNDFDNWAHLTNDPQWRYDNCLPFFKKSENYQGYFPNAMFHGSGGPLGATKQTYPVLIDEWVNAGKEMGFPTTDPNARQTSGFTPVENFIENGKRKESYNGYIKPILTRPNLHIVRYAHVTKINVDAGRKARGVDYVRNGQTITVLASKEVILSAGTIASPQILMLSGIGPAQHLKSVGIVPKVDLPGVGQNLQDHYGSYVGPFLLNDTVSFIEERDLHTDSALEYLTTHSGPMTYTGSTGIGFISVETDPNWPNVVFYLSPNGITKDTAAGFEASKKIKPGIMQKYYAGFEDRHDATFVGVAVARPASRGSITLKSNNPFDYPNIDPNYLAEASDVKALVGGFRFLVKYFEETNTWRKYNTTLIPNHFPGCEKFPLKSDGYYECFVRQYTSTNWHFTSTCKMGRSEDPMAVVDSNLRVRHVTGLRIIDASVMAQVTNANTNAPTVMIAEKGADLILKTWMRG